LHFGAAGLTPDAENALLIAADQVN